MQEDLHQLERNEIWELVPSLENHVVIRTRWVFRNKLDENDITIRNETPLVAQGYSQEQGLIMKKPLLS